MSNSAHHSSPPPEGSQQPNADDDAAAELTSMMLATRDDDALNTFAFMAPFSLASGVTTPSDGLSTARTNAALHARRLGTRYSLGPYARDLETFAVESASGRELLTFTRLLIIEQKLTRLIPAPEAYVVDKALVDNIKSYGLAVLLSPKLSQYRGSLPTQRVLAVIKHLKINVPANLEVDRHVYKAMKEAVKNELTQTRSRIKKAITASKPGQSIYELASLLVANTQCSVTPALCARLALLRKVHTQPGKAGPDYWKNVDARLTMIHTLAKGDEDMIQQAFVGMLTQDRALYGSAAQQSAQDVVPNEWETGLNEVMVTPELVTVVAPAAVAEADPTSAETAE